MSAACCCRYRSAFAAPPPPPRLRRSAFISATGPSRPRPAAAAAAAARRCRAPAMHGGAWDGGHARGHGRGLPDSASHSRTHDAHDSDDSHAPHSTSHPHDSPCCSDSHSHGPPALRFLVDLRERPSVAAAAALLLLGGALLPLPPPLARAALGLCLALTGLPALAESGARVVASRGRDLDVDALMALAAAAAVATGAALEGALLTTLYSASHAVEHAVTARARRDLDELRDLAPTLALRLQTGRLASTAPPESVPVADLAVADYVLVRAGEVVPADGVVADGAAFVVVQHLTGEARPRPVGIGDPVPAGARPVDAPLAVQVRRVGAESTMARIARLVVDAQANRPRVTRFFDRYSRAYTRLVLVLAAALALLLPPAAGVPYGGRDGSLKRALGFLVASSPCALVIGAPVAYLAALSASARRGILVKSGPRALDATADARHVVFDKTGTLTTGDLSLVAVVALPARAHRPPGAAPPVDALVPLEGAGLERVVALAAVLERGAVHPIADAIVRSAGELRPAAGADVRLLALKTVPGQGVEARLESPDGDGDAVRIGRMSFVAPGEPWLDGLAEDVADGGGMVVSALGLGDDIFLFCLRDQVRAEARAGVAQLKRQGLKVSVLTGDAEGSARLVARDVGGLDGIVANATPESKLAHIRALHGGGDGVTARRGDGGVVMVGDGVNDAPALAAATVGIACGLSSAAAVEAADVVLVRTDLRDVAWYVRKANSTQAIVKQNLVLALGLMVVAVVPTLAGAVPLWLAVTLHEGGSVLVGLNGLRLLSDRLS
jgi:Zn2+/Cd2+-exporting ATPase